jgi:hypothetical protein
MVRALPWAVSLAIHLGIAAAATLVALVVVERGRDLIIPGAVLSAEPLAVAGSVQSLGGIDGATAEAGPLRSFPLKEEVARPDAAISAGPEVQRSAALVTASPAALSPSRPMGLAAEAVSRAPASSFMGAGGYAHHVVYVVDCSGSMVSNFDDSRKAVLLSISKLQESQDFHVILFTNGKAIEMSPGRLMQAVTGNKMQVADFLAGVRVQKDSDPIPAIRRAFDVLDKAGNAPGKLIYLLSDGDFPDGGKVLSAVRERNRKGEVHINTYFCGDARDAASKSVMRQIALSSGGVYKSLVADSEK